MLLSRYYLLYIESSHRKYTFCKVLDANMFYPPPLAFSNVDEKRDKALSPNFSQNLIHIINPVGENHTPLLLAGRRIYHYITSLLIINYLIYGKQK